MADGQALGLAIECGRDRRRCGAIAARRHVSIVGGSSDASPVVTSADAAASDPPTILGADVATLPPMSAGIPPELAPLLASTAVAFVSTIGPKGEPQTTPIWFIWKDEAVHFSLVDGRQKLRNLRRDPRASVVIVDPAEPTRYLELRGQVHLVPDPQFALEREVAVKYRGAHVDVEPPGVLRFAATLAVDRVTSQSGH
jgi:PPOX class probable F420-dependent enzyme